MSKHPACPLPKDPETYVIQPVPIVGSFTAQHLLLMISTICAGLTIFISYFLIIKHLHRYPEPKQQRQIIRIIFTPVVYSALSALSIINYQVAQYMQPLIDLYETFALVSIFLLFVEYVAPDEHTRTTFFARLEKIKPKSKFRPSKGSIVVPGGSQVWYEVKYFAVFSYLVVDVLLTILEEATRATGQYCETSWSPRWSHIWIVVIKNVYLGWCVICIVKFYVRMKSEPDFAYHKPGLKLLSFKLIVAINFIQSIILGAVEIPKSQKFTGYDVVYGLPAAIVSFEQVLFAIFFHYSFRSREYHENVKQVLSTPRMGIFRAAANAFNPMDMIRGVLLMPRHAPSLLGRKSGVNRINSTRIGDGHLEPMSQQTVSRGPVQPPPSTHIPDTSYSNVYGTSLEPGNPSLAYSLQSPTSNNSNFSLAASDGYRREEETLNLTKYAR